MSGDGLSGEMTVEAYAALQAALSDPNADREALLEARGLDEDTWSALDDAWQARLSAANDADAETIPPVLVAYAEAFAAAQRAKAPSSLLPFERYLDVTRALRRGGDPTPVLGKLGVTLEGYLHAHAHWGAKMTTDAALADRFARALA